MFDNVFDFMLLLIFSIAFIVALVFGVVDYNKSVRESELVIKYSDEYEVYDECVEIDNKYYCK